MTSPSPPQSPEPPATPPGVARRLMGYLGHYRRRVAVAIALAALVGIFSAVSIAALVPVLNVILAPEGVRETLDALAGLGETGQAAADWLDGIVAGDRMRALWVIVTGLVAVTLVKGVLTFVHEYIVVTTCERAQMDLAANLFDRLTEHDEATLGRVGVSNLTARFTYDLDMTGKALSTLVGTLVLEPFRFVAAFGMALVVSWRLTLVAVLVVPPVIGLGAWLGRRIRRSAEGMLEKRARLLGRVRETLAALPVVQVYGQEERERQRFRGVTGRVLSWARKLARLEATNSPALELAAVLGTAPVLLYGGSLVVDGAMGPGEFVGAYALMAAFYSPLRKSVGASNRLQGGLAGAARIFGAMDLTPEVRERPGTRPLPPLATALTWSNVTVRYPDGRVALRGVDLQAPAGKVTALVGPSGAGKTTLLHTVPRLVDVTEGALLLDGRDVRSAPLASLRGRMALVTQEARLFGGTLRENVAYAVPDAPADDVERAGRAARVDEIVARLPDGWDTILDETGASLSGGERQRIAIARAVLRDPEILLLDEPTSSLDPENERLVRAALAELARGRTTLVVAHRRETVLSADHVVVLCDGRVESQGPPEEVARRSPTFRELFGAPPAPEPAV